VRNSPRRGYTLVEIVVALLVFTIGALALAASSGVVARTMRANLLRERAGRIAAGRIETIKSACASAASGSESVEGVESQWTVGRGVQTVSIVESTRYTSTTGSHIDTYEAVGWCSP
jgi:prepilin-type N-terminal cleavage/methylation domain-containing protein